MTPAEIEALSFEIIDAEAGPHDFAPEQWAIVRRMIHTSADFDYLRTIRFHRDAVAAGIDAIRSGKTIITDTNMVKAGITTGDLRRFGVQVKCYIADPAVSQKAAAQGITRAKTAVDAALSDMQGGIYAVGNAPTALLRLVDLVKARQAVPALIIGLPVGFVSAAESKADLTALDCPYITNVGRKGGSNVAASVVNALVKLAMQGTEP